MTGDYLRDLKKNNQTNLYINQLLDEMEEHFPNNYIIDTYAHLLEFNKFVKEDLEGLEKVMCSYLTRSERQ